MEQDLPVKTYTDFQIAKFVWKYQTVLKSIMESNKVGVESDEIRKGLAQARTMLSWLAKGPLQYTHGGLHSKLSEYYSSVKTFKDSERDEPESVRRGVLAAITNQLPSTTQRFIKSRVVDLSGQWNFSSDKPMDDTAIKDYMEFLVKRTPITDITDKISDVHASSSLKKAVKKIRRVNEKQLIGAVQKAVYDAMDRIPAPAQDPGVDQKYYKEYTRMIKNLKSLIPRENENETLKTLQSKRYQLKEFMQYTIKNKTKDQAKTAHHYIATVMFALADYYNVAPEGEKSEEQMRKIYNQAANTHDWETMNLYFDNFFEIVEHKLGAHRMNEGKEELVKTGSDSENPNLVSSETFTTEYDDDVTLHQLQRLLTFFVMQSKNASQMIVDEYANNIVAAKTQSEMRQIFLYFLHRYQEQETYLATQGLLNQDAVNSQIQLAEQKLKYAMETQNTEEMKKVQEEISRLKGELQKTQEHPLLQIEGLQEALNSLYRNENRRNVISELRNLAPKDPELAKTYMDTIRNFAEAWSLNKRADIVRETGNVLEMLSKVYKVVWSSDEKHKQLADNTLASLADERKKIDELQRDADKNRASLQALQNGDIQEIDALITTITHINDINRRDKIKSIVEQKFGIKDEINDLKERVKFLQGQLKEETEASLQNAKMWKERNDRLRESSIQSTEETDLLKREKQEAVNNIEQLTLKVQNLTIELQSMEQKMNEKVDAYSNLEIAVATLESEKYSLLDEIERLKQVKTLPVALPQPGIPEGYLSLVDRPEPVASSSTESDTPENMFGTPGVPVKRPGDASEEYPKEEEKELRSTEELPLESKRNPRPPGPLSKEEEEMSGTEEQEEENEDKRKILSLTIQLKRAKEAFNQLNIQFEAFKVESERKLTEEIVKMETTTASREKAIKEQEKQKLNEQWKTAYGLMRESMQKNLHEAESKLAEYMNNPPLEKMSAEEKSEYMNIIRELEEKVRNLQEATHEESEEESSGETTEEIQLDVNEINQILEETASPEAVKQIKSMGKRAAETELIAQGSYYTYQEIETLILPPFQKRLKLGFNDYLSMLRATG